VLRGVSGGAPTEDLSTLRVSPGLAALSLRRLVPLSKMEQRARRLWLKRAPGFEARSRRLRLGILRTLKPSLDAKALTDAELSLAVRQSMKEEAAPIRRLLLVTGALGFASVLGLSLVIGLLSWASPTVRSVFFPPDQAARASWQLSSSFPGLPASGIGARSDGDLFFHTTEEMNPSVVLSFSRTVTVRRVRIHNREDCCQERALPLNVESLGPDGEEMLCQRRAPFQSWTCHVPGVRTKSLRIRHPGFGTLHLKAIEVYE